VVRERNEDAFLLSEEEGLFAVFDGMGGHSAGDVASALARDVVLEYVRTRRNTRAPKELLERALKRASGVIYDEARRKKTRRGMGTTAVVCLVESGARAFVAHVGDSRAYLLREGRLKLLTRDHTVVSELLARGAITAADAAHHPYKSVLSKNLGGKPSTSVDSVEVSLLAGDRILLCSDGLTGFASHDAMEQVLSGADGPRAATTDLIDLALRGGGGDNVTAVVVEAGRRELPRTTTIVRTSGAPVWWSRRDRFVEHARNLGVAASPLCELLSPDEPLNIVAANMCEAIFRDLEQTTGIHVWTYTENLVSGWLDQGGGFQEVRALLDTFQSVCDAVTDDVANDGPELAEHLSVAVTRALVVAEMSLTGVLAERLRALEAEYARDDLSRTLSAEAGIPRTLPLCGGSEGAPAPALGAAVLSTLETARHRVQHSSDGLGVLGLVELLMKRDGDLLDAALGLLGERGVNEREVGALFDALDLARETHLDIIAAGLPSPTEVLVVASRAYHDIAKSLFVAVDELCRPVGDALKVATAHTQVLRDEVGRQETQISTLERGRFQTLGMSDPDATIPDSFFEEGD